MTDASYTVRAAGFEDAEAIFELIKTHPEELLPRAMSDIVQNTDRFLVCEDNGKIVGTVSWQVLPEIGKPSRPAVEIKSLAVADGLQGRGIGRLLVERAIDRIRPLHPAQIIALTFTPAFFESVGFRRIEKDQLMHKIYMGCINCTKYDSPFTCPEVAVVLEPK
jgi:amino-acid N-acetyltransferase